MSDFDRDSWATPQWLFNWLDSIYNFDIDLCADKDNNKVDRYFTKEDDALSDAINMSWAAQGVTGFFNPPYSNIKPWIKTAVMEANENNFTSVAVIPTPNGESYYADVFQHATSITYINGRVAFYNPILQKEISGNTRGTCIIEFSKRYKLCNPVVSDVDRDELKRIYG